MYTNKMKDMPKGANVIYIQAMIKFCERQTHMHTQKNIQTDDKDRQYTSDLSMLGHQNMGFKRSTEFYSTMRAYIGTRQSTTTTSMGNITHSTFRVVFQMTTVIVSNL